MSSSKSNSTSKLRCSSITIHSRKTERWHSFHLHCANGHLEPTVISVWIFSENIRYHYDRVFFSAHALCAYLDPIGCWWCGCIDFWRGNDHRWDDASKYSMCTCERAVCHIPVVCVAGSIASLACQWHSNHHFRTESNASGDEIAPATRRQVKTQIYRQRERKRWSRLRNVVSHNFGPT